MMGTRFTDVAALLTTVVEANDTKNVKRTGGKQGVLNRPNDFLPEGRRRPYQRDAARGLLQQQLRGIVAYLDQNHPRWEDYVATQRDAGRYEADGTYIPEEAGETAPALPDTFATWVRKNPQT